MSSVKFRLRKIDETRNYRSDEIKHDLMMMMMMMMMMNCFCGMVD